jgi:hypothetical protein
MADQDKKHSNVMKGEMLLPLSVELMDYSYHIARVCEDPDLKKLADFAATHEYANMNSALDQVMLLQLLVQQMNAKVWIFL